MLPAAFHTSLRRQIRLHTLTSLRRISTTPTEPKAPNVDPVSLSLHPAAKTPLKTLRTAKGPTQSEKDTTGPSISTPQTTPSTTSGRRVQRKQRKPTFPTNRPRISLTNPRKWHRPVREGFLPAYDEAVKYIKQDSENLKGEINALKQNILKLRFEIAALKAGVEDEASTEGELLEKTSQLKEMERKVAILVVQSEINLPRVRWSFANGMGDLSIPVYRHLAEQRWREDGALDLLMERIHQMHVVPDLLPSLHPSFDLRVRFPATPTKAALQTRRKRKFVQVEPGSFLLPEQSRKPPKLYTSVFHTDTRYYTLFLVDLDVPDPANALFTSYLHWLVPNIPLSAATSGELTIPHSPQRNTLYVPPHPQQGTRYHRYALLLLPNPVPTDKIKVESVKPEGRLGFNLRAWCSEHGFSLTKDSTSGAAYMWREIWDETVSRIYRETLRTPEPVYGRARKPDPYKEVKQRGKYTQL